MRRLVIDRKQELVAWAAERLDLRLEVERCCAIGLEDDEAVIAVVVFNQYSHPGICGHIVSDGSRRWLNRLFLRAMFDYPFRQLQCVRISAPISEGNAQAIEFVKRLGFVQEGRLRRAMPDGSDRLIFGLLKEDCRWVS